MALSTTLAAACRRPDAYIYLYLLWRTFWGASGEEEEEENRKGGNLNCQAGRARYNNFAKKKHVWYSQGQYLEKQTRSQRMCQDTALRPFNGRG